jgi:propanol-preferring alcohol dehydrogenase
LLLLEHVEGLLLLLLLFLNNTLLICSRFTIVPARYVVCLPEGLEDCVVAPIMCGGVTVYKALKICGAVPGQCIAISGAGGGVGALGVQYARAMGYRVIAIDGGAVKGNYCRTLGADVYVDFLTEKNVPEAVKRATDGKGAQAVLVIAGSARAYQEGLEMLAPFGTLVCIGIPPPTDLVKFHPLQFIDMGFKVIGTSVGTRLDVSEALEYVKRGLVSPKVEMIRFEDLNDVIGRLTTGEVSPPVTRNRA